MRRFSGFLIVCLLVTALLSGSVFAANTIKLSKQQVSIVKGKTFVLKATTSGTSQKVKWSSSNKSIATVSSKGKVTAKKAGKAVITAKINGAKATCSVTVTKPTIKLSKTSATIEKGKTVSLKATVVGKSSNVTWSSSNKKVATVNSKGTVTGKKAGTATITAKANGVKATCKVTVKQKSASSSNLKAKYHITRYSTYYRGKRTGRYTFELPQLEGDSEEIQKINASLKEVYRESWKTRDNLKIYTFGSDDVQVGDFYWYDTTCEVTYNKKGIVCFRFADDWFAGGVHNASHYGASYNLKTGKKLLLNDVMSGTKTSIINKVVKAYSKILPDRDPSVIRRSLSYTPFEEKNFWLPGGKVYFSNGSYAPGGGNGECTIVLNGNY